MLNFMLQPKFQNNFKPLKKNSPLENSSLVLFFHLSQAKREDLEKLIHFVQTYNLKIKPIQNKKFSDNYIMKNANFVAQSRSNFSPVEFQRLIEFLPSNILMVGFFYQNQIWSFSRLQKFENHFPFSLQQYNYFRKNLQKIVF